MATSISSPLTAETIADPGSLRHILARLLDAFSPAECAHAGYVPSIRKTLLAAWSSNELTGHPRSA
jgi:hypothetical protein